MTAITYLSALVPCNPELCFKEWSTAILGNIPSQIRDLVKMELTVEASFGGTSLVYATWSYDPAYTLSIDGMQGLLRTHPKFHTLVTGFEDGVLYFLGSNDLFDDELFGNKEDASPDLVLFCRKQGWQFHKASSITPPYLEEIVIPESTWNKTNA